MVVKVLDADSINIIQQGEEIRIRLAGIDTLECGSLFGNSRYKH